QSILQRGPAAANGGTPGSDLHLRPVAIHGLASQSLGSGAHSHRAHRCTQPAQPLGCFAEAWTLVVTSQRVVQMAEVAINAPDAVSSPSGSRIVVRDLKAWYGSRQAIGGVGLNIAPRQVTAIIGPSGCGKSTLIRCLN